MWRAAALSAAKLPPHVSLWIRRRRSSNGQTSVIKRGMIVQTEQERPGAWLDHVGELDGHRNCFEWFAEESKSIAEQATCVVRGGAQRPPFTYCMVFKCEQRATFITSERLRWRRSPSNQSVKISN